MGNMSICFLPKRMQQSSESLLASTHLCTHLCMYMCVCMNLCVCVCVRVSPIVCYILAVFDILIYSLFAAAAASVPSAADSLKTRIAQFLLQSKSKNFYFRHCSVTSQFLFFIFIFATYLFLFISHLFGLCNGANWTILEYIIHFVRVFELDSWGPFMCVRVCVRLFGSQLGISYIAISYTIRAAYMQRFFAFKAIRNFII